MVDKSNENPPNFETIKPMALDRGSDDLNISSTAKKPIDSNRLTQITIVALTLLLALVVFWLPNAISPVTPSQQDNQSAPTVQHQIVNESPWQDAQLAKYRKQAQKQLSELLSLQESLIQKQVHLWAEESFLKINGEVEIGDEYYRQRQFEEAMHQYKQGIASFNDLLNQGERVFAQSMENAIAAFEDDQFQAAIEHFELALAITPSSEEAIEGQRRANNLEAVLAELTLAKAHQQQGDLSKAKSFVERGLKLDNKHNKSLQLLAELDQLILEQKYAKAMSSGYDALQLKQYPLSIKSFSTALQLKPNSAIASKAQKQAENESTDHKINLLITDATKLESEERWHQAQKKYQEALALDTTLVTARVANIRTGVRAELDSSLEKTLSERERLWENAVYQQALKLQTESSKIPQQGPKLKTQLAQLAVALKQARTPVAVTLKSDSQTSVVMYRVGPLGLFNDKNMELTPGKYTLVGTRNGYRDVRKQITILPDAASATYVIQCQEKILKG